MNKLFRAVLLCAVACSMALGSVEEDVAAISQVAHQMIPTKNSDQYVGAFQRLAVALGDIEATSLLRNGFSTDEFQHGLRVLLADVNRAMWVYNDDKETLNYLRIIASRIKAAL
ncbi:hypothetical protein GGF46_005058 [Coemansia sp. RSA 552]|nr:hypothetical protein GGF46_005058 [Coemansia sp. RSA 552]